MLLYCINGWLPCLIDDPEMWNVKQLVHTDIYESLSATRGRKRTEKTCGEWKDTWSQCEDEDARLRCEHIQVISTTTEAHTIHQRGSVNGKQMVHTRQRTVSHLFWGRESGNVSAVTLRSIWEVQHGALFWEGDGIKSKVQLLRVECPVLLCLTQVRVWCVGSKKMAVELSLQSKRLEENLSFHLVYSAHSLVSKDGRC